MNIAMRVIDAARERAQQRKIQTTQEPCYGHLAEWLERQRQLDRAGLGPALARLRHAPGNLPPHSPGLKGRATNFVFRLIAPLVWRLIRVCDAQSLYSAVYDTLIEQAEWQLAMHRQLSAELAELRAELDALKRATPERVGRE